MEQALKWSRRGVASLALAGLAQGVGFVAFEPLADANSGAMRATTALNVRTQPTTNSPRIGVIYPGERVDSTGPASNGWVPVLYKGKRGFVSAQFVTTVGGGAAPAPSGQNTSVKYTTANLNLRTGPSTGHRVVRVAPRGTQLSVTGQTQNGFAKVIDNGKELWASSQYLADQAPGAQSSGNNRKVRTTDNVHARESANANSRSYGVVPRGTTLDTTGQTQNGWTQVIWKGNARWMASQYLQEASTNSGPNAPSLPNTQTRYTTGALNVWRASTGDAFDTVIPAGATIQTTGKVQNGRAEIVHNGALRWVTAKYVSSTPPIDAKSLNRGYSSGLDKANKYIQRIAQHVWDTFPEIKTQYGWRRDVTPDHPAGRAVDVMIPGWRNQSGRALGTRIAEYFRANAGEFKINYIIWDQKIWLVGTNVWKPMASRGNDTANHKDHVHINTYDVK